MPAQDAQNDGTLLFDFMPARTVVLRPAAGQLTSDAGLLAIRQFDERVGWTRRFCACLADERLDPVHTIESMIHQRVYGILAGYEDCNDHDALRGEPIFKMIAGRLPEDDPLASQPTLSRLENSVQPAELLQLVDLMIELGIERVKRKHRGRIPDRVTIDLDPTDDPTHGQQQLTFFHGYYDQHQYFPMIISEPTTRHVFVAWLRHGKAPAALGADDDIRRIAAAFQKASSRTRLHVRGDTGLGGPDLYDMCEKDGHTYVFGFGATAPLKRWAQSLLERAETKYRRTGEKQRLFAFRSYRAKSWTRSRTVIAKAECSAEGVNLRFIVTNLPVRSKAQAEEVYDGYVQRGACEQRMDELKNGLGAGRLSCHRFCANFLRLMLHAHAFNLLNALRDHRYVPEELRAARPETWRTKVIKVAAVIQQTTRRVWVEISSAWPFWPLLDRVGRRALRAPRPRAASP